MTKEEILFAQKEFIFPSVFHYFREPLVMTVIERLEALVAHMKATGSNLDHIPIYVEDLRYIRDNQHNFTEAIRV